MAKPRTTESLAAECQANAERIVETEALLASLYAQRLALWSEGTDKAGLRMTQAAVAVASGVSEGAVTQALRKVRLAVNS
jgi:hypothetical protein